MYTHTGAQDAAVQVPILFIHFNVLRVALVLLDACHEHILKQCATGSVSLSARDSRPNVGSTRLSYHRTGHRLADSQELPDRSVVTRVWMFVPKLQYPRHFGSEVRLLSRTRSAARLRLRLRHPGLSPSSGVFSVQPSPHILCSD